MATLQEIYQEISQFTNGEIVTKRMLQLEALARNPENEHLAPSAHRVMDIITERETKLLNINFLTQFDKHFPLKRLKATISQTEDSEFEQFKNELNIPDLSASDTRRLLIDASGLVDEKFDEWVLGKDQSEAPPIEGTIIRTIFDRPHSEKK